MHLISITVFAAAITSAVAASISSGAPYCPPRPATSQQKRAILEEFAQKLFIDRDPVRASNDHVAIDYIQHNPTALSGRDNQLLALAFVTPETVNFTIRHLGLDGDIGFIFSRLDMVGAEQPTAVADFVRFNGTCLQEHWDVLQERPANRTNPLDMW
ncbi:hypothetical protein BS50DRAFT_293049 [Corynespora cassiicola Philippines]|uniref:SnoaL-like domain-containing protein n=1 Tax=Corynespora cassiicola Philippines TaxID=1448308 RepID=A0A2T2NW55_CORCC|nr:hypothetical protein BS50DRAFT_293049 [Corynespora cassiicola Philippines]